MGQDDQGPGRNPPGAKDRPSADLTWTIRKLELADTAAYVPLRLDALRRHPEAFGADVSEETPETITPTAGPPPSATFGAFAAGALVGSVTLVVSVRKKLRHVGQVFGVYVAPEWRRTGLAHALMQTLIDHGREAGLSSLILSVTRGNDNAQDFYESLGFKSYGTQPQGLRVDGKDYDVELMRRSL